MSHRTDPYGVLGVARTATRGQIRAAYRRLARELHPDANADPKAARRFARVSHAYETLGDPVKRKAYDERGTWGRFAAPGTGGPASFAVEGAGAGRLYHSDLGHHSDFYQAGDPLTVAEAAVLVGRHPAWLRRAIRTRRLPAVRENGIYLLRRRDVERLDRTAKRRPPRAAQEPSDEPARDADPEGAAEA
jgi:curved DNA-binding protein CbpA